MEKIFFVAHGHCVQLQKVIKTLRGNRIDLVLYPYINSDKEYCIDVEVFANKITSVLGVRSLFIPMREHVIAYMDFWKDMSNIATFNCKGVCIILPSNIIKLLDTYKYFFTEPALLPVEPFETANEGDIFSDDIIIREKIKKQQSSYKKKNGKIYILNPITKKYEICT